jgi:hypothetical protein
MARSYCAADLASLGFTVGEEPFDFSRFPGEWATPAGGAAACLTTVTAGALAARGHHLASLVVVVAATAIAAAIAIWLARRGVLGLPWMRTRSTNLVATRGTPSVWLVAHLDSKSQPVPMLGRIVGIAASATALVAVASLDAMAMHGLRPSAGVWITISLGGVIAALPVIASTVGARSAGAVDDASGVVAVLRAAAHLPREMPIGLVLTSAEELGMAGACAFAEGRLRGVALNVDGVDDRGTFLCMVHGHSPDAHNAVRRAADALTMNVRTGWTIPGVLTDGVALANAGWDAVTLSRGTLATLSRIHRRADDLNALRGDGIEEMARLLATAAREIG